MSVLEQVPQAGSRRASVLFLGRDFGSLRPGWLRSRQEASRSYLSSKRAFDLSMCVALLPLLVAVALALLVLNPFFNQGRLFFVQERMGLNCRPFRAYKFRTMIDAEAIKRGPFDTLDDHRITPLGRMLRKLRLDELPQLLNVLKGEMSLIGPRPDYYAHADVYLHTVAGYRERHAALPGISGYAQVAVGYAEGLEGVRAKVAADLYYIQRASLAFDLWIACRTLRVVLGARGL